jgi:hypothetical protein
MRPGVNAYRQRAQARSAAAPNESAAAELFGMALMSLGRSWNAPPAPFKLDWP